MDPFCVRFPSKLFSLLTHKHETNRFLYFRRTCLCHYIVLGNLRLSSTAKLQVDGEGSVAKECKTNFCLTPLARPLLFVHSPPECCGNSKSFKTLNGFYFLIFVAVARKHLFLSGKQILVNGNEKLLPERMDWDTSKNVKKKLKFTRHYGSRRLSHTDLRVNEPRKSQDLLSFRRKVPSFA